MRQRHEEYDQKLLAYYAERRISIKQNRKLSPKSKKQLNQALYLEMRDDLERQKHLEKAQKGLIREQYPIPSWGQWLVECVKQKNLAALVLLRNQERTRRGLVQDLLTVTDITAARDLIHPYITHLVNRQGDITYRLKDGGIVEDTAGAVHVPQLTEASALLALSLSQERFQGQGLRVEGTVEFKVEIAEQSGRLGLNLRFEDAELEAIRQKHLKPHQSAQEQKFRPEFQQEQAKKNESGRER